MPSVKVSKGIGGGGNAPTAPTNPMPVLTAEVREALVASIREHGVICPVIKDQEGFVLDGYNRVQIATDLGITYPETIYTCTPDQREILRIELNGARRQISARQWKPLVDHLRTLRTKSGHRYSDRAIAQAVGVDKMAVSRYKPQKAGVSSDTPAPKVGKDGKVQHQDPQWTATDRALHLIQQSTTGLTAADLRNDTVLQGFGASTVSKIPTQLAERGLIEADGKRDRSTVWRIVANPAPPSPPTSKSTTVTRKADKIIEDLKDERVRDAVREGMVNSKGTREASAALRAAEKELDAARLDQEKRAAEDERERLKLIEIARAQADKSIKTWDKLISEVRAAWTMIAAYSADLDDLPAISPSFERMLDRELGDLSQQLEWLDKRLHPGGHNVVSQGSVIDV